MQAAPSELELDVFEISIRRTGIASKSWGRYDPNPLPRGFQFRRPVRRLQPSGKRVQRDPMADYIEGAEWWIARSERSQKALLRAFDNEEVACCLIERVGAILPMGREDDAHFRIAIQLVRTGDDWDVDLCLSEIGVYLDEVCIKDLGIEGTFIIHQGDSNAYGNQACCDETECDETYDGSSEADPFEADPRRAA